MIIIVTAIVIKISATHSLSVLFLFFFGTFIFIYFTTEQILGKVSEVNKKDFLFAPQPRWHGRRIAAQRGENRAHFAATGREKYPRSGISRPGRNERQTGSLFLFAIY